MPAAIAHYQMANLVSEKLPCDILNIITNHREMYDLGAQGPDILFFYRPVGKNHVSQTGHDFHDIRAREFLSHIFKIRDLNNESQTAYILGMCAHYALDRNAHPLVFKLAPGTLAHQLMEGSFERLIREEYKLKTPRQRLLPVKNLCYKSLSKIYHGINEKELKEAILTLRGANLCLNSKPLVVGFEKVVGIKRAFSTLCIPKTVVDKNAKLLLPHFKEAIYDAINLMKLYTDENTSLELFEENTRHNFEGQIN